MSSADKSHPLKDTVCLQKQGIPKGVYSVCSANEYVIQTAIEKAKLLNTVVYIEATANQVNQYGGYTGMKPEDFKNFVYSIASQADLPLEKLILGADHLGPLTWKNEDSVSAMEKSHELIKQYIMAGFSKIHIDTSMHLRDDNHNEKLPVEIIASRGAELCKTAEETFNAYKLMEDNDIRPVYIIGSEVPIPGGSQENDDIEVTSKEDFVETIDVYRKIFKEFCLEEAWENIVGVVVQPGVEYGDDTVHEYNSELAKDLTSCLKNYPNIVFEGHSTDYQTAEKLKKMVEDGIAVLKVGPALTFALREALFALNCMEEELFKNDSTVRLSNFRDILDGCMIEMPTYWEKHYHGNSNKIKLSRKYSYSDRCRYYLPFKEVRAAVDSMLVNLKKVQIPLTLISQYMPLQYMKIRNGIIGPEPELLIKDRIINYIDDYIYAITKT